jgi:putative transposase
MKQEPYYGHRRLAYKLGCNPKKTLRIMKKYDLRCRFRRPRFKYQSESDNTNENKTIVNELGSQKPCQPNQYWSGDFTYIPFETKFIFLAIQKDLFTREVTGFDVKITHSKELVTSALIDGLEHHQAPHLSHSDQGSEYRSQTYQETLRNYNIISSMSHKASPWENGYAEGFFSSFKLEFGSFKRFQSLAELTEAIYQWIDYYNTTRIHTAIKTSPTEFRKQWEQKQKQHNSLKPRRMKKI